MIAFQAESKVLVGTQDGTPMTGSNPPDQGCEGRRKYTVLLSPPGLCNVPIAFDTAPRHDGNSIYSPKLNRLKCLL